MSIKNISFFIIITLFIGLPSTAKDRNVLLITLDTLRWDRLSINSNKYVKTPAIDKMANQGAIFDKAFAHTPLTLPSHANILTGTTPLYHGISNNSGFKLAKKFLTLTEYLKEHNFWSAAFVASIILSKDFGLNQGFMVYKEPTKKTELPADVIIKQTIQWLKSVPDNQKWFCWVHLYDPHTPYAPPEQFRKEYSKDLYSGEVAFMDAELGKLFKFLGASGKLTNTLIVLTSDHGEGLGDHKEYEHGFFAYNSTIHIPLIFIGEGIPKKHIKQYVSHVDIFPTICDLLKIQIPDNLQGESLLPLMKGRRQPERPIYFESKGPYYNKGWAPLEGYIEAEKKYIDLPIPELYDLKNDFTENKNIIRSFQIPTLKKTIANLKKMLAGIDTKLAQKDISQSKLQKLRTLGYLSGFKQKRKTRFTRSDDLKVLIDIQILLEKANHLALEKKYIESIKLYHELIKKRPDYIGAYIYLSEVYEETKQFQSAEFTLQEGLKIAPDNLELKSRLAILLTQSPKIDTGIQMLKEILAKEDLNAENWNHLGIAYFIKGNFKLAFEAYKKALDLNKTFDLALNNMGLLYFSSFSRTNKIEYCKQAWIFFDRAIKVNPEFDKPYNGRAAVYTIRKEYDYAIKDWKKALSLNPEFTDIYFNLATTLISLNRSKEARGYLEILKKNYFHLLNPDEQKSLEQLLNSIIKGG